MISMRTRMKGRGAGLSPGGAAAWVLRHSDATLALAVAGIVAMMILPLPTWLLDILLTLNISVAVLLLLVVLYVPEPLAIATFPTILLLTTLYRLALNVSSTRLILLQADAGRVIDAFGNFVVSGNFVVGAVIFLILTLVQFIVVAKGSERVAEVAARFTLDAMPGKQMSIDADLRAGIIDSKEARRRRANLEREAQFYGAMDGGMRFVKGDAVAAICITVINISAGLIIGVLQMGMELEDAARTFTLLTIGDGLVSQIPALIISTSAGFVITRVASEDTATHLGLDVGRQIMKYPRALKIVALLLLLIGIIPGMPLGPFALLGIATGFIAWSADRMAKKRAAAGRPADRGPEAGAAGEPEREGERPPLLRAVMVELSPRIDEQSGNGTRLAELIQRKIPGLRSALFDELGLRLPPVYIRTSDAMPAGENLAVYINEVPASRARARPGMLYVSLSPSQLADAGLKAVAGTDPAGMEGGSWLEESQRERLSLYVDGGGIMDVPRYAVACVEWAVKKHSAELLGTQQVQEMLDLLEGTHPALVRNAVPKPVELSLLTDVCRRLVSEGVSLRYMEQILETLQTWAPHERDGVALTELVRSSLKRAITARHAAPGGKLDAFLLSSTVEEGLRSSIHRTRAGGFLALAPDLSRSILDAVRREVEPCLAARGSGDAVVVTQADIRRYFRKLVENEFPRLAVLSFSEVDDGTTLIPIGEISVADAPESTD
jgi:type III secretion protein V